MIKASVIVPVYNVEQYLEECLDSILGQTLQAIEVICVEAGSTDASPDILRRYAARDSRVIIVDNMGRLDGGAARNAGIAVAKGQYLAFLDSDDYFDPTMLEDACRKADEDESDVVVFKARQHDMRTGKVTDMPWSLDEKLCPDHSPFAPKEMADHIFNAFKSWPWNKIFRRSMVAENGIAFQSIARTNDFAFTNEALARAKRISILPKAYPNYRVGTGTSLQQTNDRSPTCFWYAFKETRARLMAAGVYDTFRKSFLNAVLSGALYNLRSVKTEEAYREILFLLKYRSQELDLHTLTRRDVQDAALLRQYERLTANVRCITAPAESPVVTVALPCLNGRAYIRECVESIMEQRMTALEILIIDAGSTDGTLDILAEYAAIDPRIRILHSDKKSYGYQLNLALRQAKGKYFAIVEADDYIKPDMYADLCRIADRRKLEVLKADYASFVGSRQNRKYTHQSIARNNALYNKLIDPARDARVFGSYVVSWCGIYLTEFLRSNNIYHHESPGASFQDNGFWFQVFTQAHRVMFYDKAYYMLRRDNPGSSVYNPAKAYCMVAEYDFIRQFLREHPALEKQYAPLCALKRFRNYLWANENLVQDEHRAEYITRFAEEFRTLTALGEIDQSLFKQDEYETLQLIMAQPGQFCADYQAKRDAANDQTESAEATDATLQRLLAENKRLRNDVKNLRRSVSFRIGRAITFLPRKARNLVRYFLTNGAAATAALAVHKARRLYRRAANKLCAGYEYVATHGLRSTVKRLLRPLKR